jgi:hypothetical protein
MKSTINQRKYSRLLYGKYKQLPIEFETNPQILFYDLLIYDRKIERFENIHKKTLLDNIQTKNEKIDNFYISYLKMCQDFIWNEFKLPYIYFILLYRKARKLRKKIFKYAIEKKIRIIDILDSYNPKLNLTNLNEHNWNIPIEISYKRFIDKKIRDAKLKNSIIQQTSYNYFDKTNLLVLARTNIKKKKLMFSGKLCNVYLQDPDTRNKKLFMKSLNSPDDNKREQIIKIKENFFKKKIKNKPKYNTMNNSIYDNTISTNKKFFSLRKKLIKYQPLDNPNNLLETENSLVNKFNFNRYNSLKKLRKKYIRIKNNVNSYSQLSSFYLNKDDFFYT